MFAFVSIQLEKEFLSLILKNAENCEKAVAKITIDDLASPLMKDFFYEISEHYKKYNTILSKPELEQKVLDKFKEKEIAKEYIKKIYEENSASSIDNIIDSLKEKRKARDLSKTIHDIAQQLENGDLSKCDSLLYSFLENSCENTGFKEVDLMNNTKNLLNLLVKERENPSGFDGVPTGMQGIDKIICGLKKSELGLLVAKTGGYKSTTLTNIAGNALMMGKKVVYFVIESAPEQYAFNLYSYVSGVLAEKLQTSTASDEEIIKVYNTMNKIRELGGDIIFIDAPQNLNPTTLQMEIRKLKRKHGRVDLVIIDYLQIMDSEGGNKGDPYDWKRIITISKQLKSIARAENTPIWTAAQKAKVKNNLKTKEKETHDTEDIAYAKGITDNVDVAIEVYQSDTDKLMGIIQFFFLKARRSKFINNQGIRVLSNISYQVVDQKSTDELKAKVFGKPEKEKEKDEKPGSESSKDKVQAK